MRLINTLTLELEEFQGHVPPYAILSHTWGDSEVLYRDMLDLGLAREKKAAGFRKIEQVCAKSLERGYSYVWVDTCCIDKSSSAELSEAINSMYRYYLESELCWALLSDLEPEPESFSLPRSLNDAGDPPELHESRESTAPDDTQGLTVSTSRGELEKPDEFRVAFSRCRWFTRGWTLQELIAPRNIEFVDREWRTRGTKKTLVTLLRQITNVNRSVLGHTQPLEEVPLARRMSWASQRNTTRVEDKAYCLMGIFGVHMVSFTIFSSILSAIPDQPRQRRI